MIYDLRIKKHLGQNFLKNKKILEEIVKIGGVSKKDIVLEVGPGHGELTGFLAQGAKTVIAIEKDKNLVPMLREKFRNNKNVEIREGDILKSKVLNLKSEYKIIANIPYYITSHFLRNTLAQKNKPSLIVLMVQLEVAKRISAKVPDMNLLALSVQAYGKVEFIRKVSAGNFSPTPKVDSAIIKISEISDKFFRKNKISEKKFFKILRKVFQQKRKMLRGTIGNKIPEEYQTNRPEELSLEDLIKIYSEIN